MSKYGQGHQREIVSSQDRLHVGNKLKHQALTLDAVGPISHLLEAAFEGELTQKAAIEAAQTALKLLGNALPALQNMNTRFTEKWLRIRASRSCRGCRFGAMAPQMALKGD